MAYATTARTDLCPFLRKYGVDTYLLVTQAVTASKLANFGVETGKIGTAAVTNAKIADAIIGMGSANDGSTAGKLNAKFQIATTAASNAVVTVPHGLARAAVGYDVIRCDKDSTIYDGSTVFTATNIYIKSTRQSTLLTLRVY
jgi:hypothetical protein